MVELNGGNAAQVQAALAGDAQWRADLRSIGFLRFLLPLQEPMQALAHRHNHSLLFTHTATEATIVRHNIQPFYLASLCKNSKQTEAPMHYVQGWRQGCPREKWK